MNKIPNKEQRTINDSINDLITSRLNDQPHPVLCTITHLYNDGKVDINTEQYGELKYIDTITTHNIGDTSVLLFLNQSLNERIII